MTLRLIIEDGKFRDQQRRHVTLRGINVAGDAKHPSTPDQPSHVSADFFDGDHVKFHQRPFPKEHSHIHFARLKSYGYNTIRYVFTWEAIEAAGPGIYDEEWIDHTIEVLRVAKVYGFYVFMDPHQDVWSRFTGGSGAPMWTLYACGLNPRSFAATEASIVHNVYPDRDNFPKMIWSSNYYRLATATMFTLFFAGKIFAPKCIIDGVNIQDYLQDHFINACAYLARRIHEAGDIEDEVVFGWETLNEPSRGMIGYKDITAIPKEQALKKGSVPTMWQTILTGSGRAVEVETWDMGQLGPFRVGNTLIDPHGESAWLPANYDDSRYKYKRHVGWKLGTCLWEQQGVWDSATDTLLKGDYFSKNPQTGEAIDSDYFTNNFLMDFIRKYRDAVRLHHRDAILLLQGPTMEVPPNIKGTADDENNLVYAPHWYDGITLMTKKWNRNWNVDVLGVLRGRYLHPAFAIKIGETAVRNCFRNQFLAMKREGIDNLGDHPILMTEFGIPYDMDEKHAYKTGDYSSQTSAMDANHFAVEALDGYTLWLYMTKNDHFRGDQWNGEDLSIFSLDDDPLPVSPIPKTPSPNQSCPNLVDTATRDPDDDSSVTPSNLKQTLTNASIGSEVQSAQPELTASPGYRAGEAFVRPAPVATVGTTTHYAFDLRRCEFSLTLQAHNNFDPVGEPTLILLPEFHFPQQSCMVDNSSGRWEIYQEQSGTALVQMMKWWHDAGEQTIKVTGLVRPRPTAQNGAEEPGYYEQCNTTAGDNCAVM